MNWTALTQPLYRRTSPLRAPLCITPLHLSDNLPYPSHTLLPDPKTPTPPLLSLQSECHQYGYLGGLFIPPTAVSKKLSSFTHDMGHKPIVQLPTWRTRCCSMVFHPKPAQHDQGPNCYSIQISQPHKGVTLRENFSDKLNFK